jgi:hypothetical protein
MPIDGAANPLPFARRAVVRLPLPQGEAIPVAVRDAAGARHPAQLVDDEDGRALLVELELGALAATTFEPLAERVAGAWWEVSERVLDNGRVRAELDETGRIARLCWDGVFADWNGPAVDPRGGGGRARVLESSPVRAVVTVEREEVELRYVIHAHEDCLRISARRRGGVPVELAHPAASAGSIIAPTPEAGGLRWFALVDGLGRGLAFASAAPITARVIDGCAFVDVRDRLDYALLAAQRPVGALGLAQVAETLTCGHLAHAGPPREPRFRVVAPQHVLVGAHRDIEAHDEILLAEQAGARAKVYIHAPRPLSGAKVDASGRTIAAVRPTPEGDGLLIELAARETARIRF